MNNPHSHKVIGTQVEKIVIERNKCKQQRAALLAALKAFTNTYVKNLPVDHKDFYIVANARIIIDEVEASINRGE